MSNKILKGIDVSTWQGNIDFAKLDKTKVEFALCRASFGWSENQKDNRFERNIEGFKRLGIPCGAYHYSYARNCEEALKEAEYFLSCIEGHKFELPVFYDMEESSVAALGKKACTEIAKTFCEAVQKKGYLVGIYTNPNWLANYLNYEQIKQYELWLASWGASKPSYPCGVWQYGVGSAGTVAGISGEIDLNYMYKDYPAIVKKVGYNGFKTNETETNSVTNTPCVESNHDINVGDRVTVTNPINYDTNKPFIVYDTAKYTVMEIVRDRAVIGIEGNVTAAVNVKYLKKYDTDIKTGSKVKLKPGTTTYLSTIKLQDWCYNAVFDVMEIVNNRAVIGINGNITAAVDAKNLILQ